MAQPPRLIAAMTDGVADDALESEHNLRALFSGLETIVGAEAPAERLLDSISYEKRGSFDDRTIVLFYPAPELR
jgi:hypothetical protein